MKEIIGLGPFADMVQTWADAIPELILVAKEGSAKEIKKIVDSIYGSSELESLSEDTQASRVRAGYTPNEPLLRDGTLLKDSVQIFSTSPNTISIGSTEPIHAYHEYGYYDARGNTFVPPRPVFRIAAAKSAPIIEKMIELETFAMLMHEPKPKTSE